MTGRLFVWFGATVTIAVALFALAVNRMIETRVIDDRAETLAGQARLIRSALPSAGVDLQAAVIAWSRASGLRITAIAIDGTVLADSSRDPASMEDHADRPEVVAALAGEVGTATRMSESVGVEFRYVAVPPENGRIVRVAEPTTAGPVRPLTAAVVFGAAGAFLLGLAAVWWGTRRIVRPFHAAAAAARRIAEGTIPEPSWKGGSIELQQLVGSVEALATELRRRAEASDEERTLRDRLLGSLEEGVILVEADDSITYANSRALRVLGSRSARSSLPAELQRICLEARRSQGPVRADFDHGVPPRTLAAAANLLGAAGAVAIVLQDVTASRRVESMRRDFVTDASHELKTPIAAIQAGAETIGRAIDEDPAEAKRFTEQVRDNAVRVGRIVSDLLDLSRLETEEPRFETVDLARLVSDELALLNRPGVEASVTVFAALSPVSVLGSSDDIRLAVRNLLENAQRYAAGGEVRVTVERSEDEAVVEVADTGIGIPSRDVPRIFERFYRVDVARSRHTGGTGLGLAIVRHVMDRHGGRVEVRSELGKGSTFRLHFPLTAG